MGRTVVLYLTTPTLCRPQIRTCQLRPTASSVWVDRSKRLATTNLSGFSLTAALTLEPASHHRVQELERDASSDSLTAITMASTLHSQDRTTSEPSLRMAHGHSGELISWVLAAQRKRPFGQREAVPNTR